MVSAMHDRQKTEKTKESKNWPNYLKMDLFGRKKKGGEIQNKC